ncbi:MAG TPA: hypothetical protein VGO80_06165 [Solirubrobacteraceae bacterium]|jgi:hypothetical protein|nr:hypothetical protein [Solirubrobacteraceae bacterium]
MSGAGLLYAISTAITGTDGVWIAVADADGALLAHERLVGHSDIEFVNLLAVWLAAGVLADLDIGRGVIVTDSTLTVTAVHRRGGEPPRGESARARAELAREISTRLGVGWVVAWAPRDVNFTHGALSARLSAVTNTATKERR